MLFLKLPLPSDDVAVNVISQIASVEFNIAETDALIWEANAHGEFSIKGTYKAVSVHKDHVKWRSRVWFKQHIPRHSLFAWIFMADSRQGMN